MDIVVFWFNIFTDGPINNMPVLIQMMAFSRSADTPLSDPMMALFTDMYASLDLNEITSEISTEFCFVLFWSHYLF